MALLRTRRLGFHQFTATPEDAVLYTCPPVSRAVVHELAVASGGSTSQVTAYLIPSGGSATFWLFRQTLAANDAVIVRLQTVLEVGDALHVFSTLPGPLVWASGAQLDLPA